MNQIINKAVKVDASDRLQQGQYSDTIEIISDTLPVTEGTIARSIKISGRGVHSGKNVTVQLYPAGEGSGIVLRRVDLKNGHRDIAVRYDCVELRKLCTKVVNSFGTEVSMVEHLMCALFISNIDNVLVELNAAELPILDGSAEQWLVLIEDAEVVRQNRARRYLQVRGSVESREDDRFCRLLPHKKNALAVDFRIDFSHKVLGQQHLRLFGEPHKTWRSEIASARTFVFRKDIEKLREQNFALGGSLDNALVIDDDGVVNPEGLRFEDEFVRHKILDLCGDLYLAGMPILGRIEANKSGHRLNNRLLKALFENKNNAWREVRVRRSTALEECHNVSKNHTEMDQLVTI